MTLRSKLLSVFAILAVLVCTPARAQEVGPFGLTMAMPSTALSCFSEPLRVNPYTCRLRRVPVSNAFFVTYYATAAPNAGLCSVYAYSALYDAADVQVVAHNLHRIRSGLADKYGPPQTEDDLSVSEQTLASMGLRTGLNSEWSLPIAEPRSDGVGGIRLSAILRDDRRWEVQLSYFFTNLAACQDEAEAWRNREQSRGL